MYAFPPGAQLQPGEVAVVAGQAAVFLARYGQPPDFELRESDPLVPDMVRYTAWAGGSMELGNTGDELLLLDANDGLEDALSWRLSTLRVDRASTRRRRTIPGALPGGSDTNTAADWREQESLSPGSIAAAVPTPAPAITPTPLPPGVLVLNEIHADPHLTLGDANGDGTTGSSEDEFIEIVNMLPVSADLSGWSLQDALRTRHLFPPGSQIRAGWRWSCLEQPAHGDFGGSHGADHF
jgi:hypothetical protein